MKGPAPLSRLTTALALAAALLAVGCEPRQVRFRLRFEQTGTQASVSAIRVRILEGDCAGSTLYSSVFDVNDPDSARLPPVLAPGPYAFEVEARNEDCQILAGTCVRRELPVEGELLELLLAEQPPSPACPSALCTRGRCADDEPDAGPPGGGDAGSDGGGRDAGPRVDAAEGTDAGPLSCTRDESCPSSTCREGVCCGGCWDGASCQPGTAAAACGIAGGACEACSGEEICGAGACRGPVSLSMSAITSYIRTDGRLYSAGVNDSRQRGRLLDDTPAVFAQQQTNLSFADVAATQTATCGLDLEGFLYCWGGNEVGQLGIGSSDRARREETPQRVGNDRWRDVAAGNAHFCAIRADRRLFCWGANGQAQLGVGDRRLKTEPTRVALDREWLMVGPGAQHTCAIDRAGELFCWGEGSFGRLGLGDTSLASGQVGAGGGWSWVSGGVEHTCGVRMGDLYCWGNQRFGRLGNGNGAEGEVLRPALIDDTRTWVRVGAGQFHGCALSQGDGSQADAVFCWGVGSALGATGLGPTGAADVAVPTEVATGFDVLAVGWSSSCAAARDDAGLTGLRCWGDAERGQLGTGEVTPEFRPVRPTFRPNP